jgi:hypothetical protein
MARLTYFSPFDDLVMLKAWYLDYRCSEYFDISQITGFPLRGEEAEEVSFPFSI